MGCPTWFEAPPKHAGFFSKLFASTPPPHSGQNLGRPLSGLSDMVLEPRQIRYFFSTSCIPMSSSGRNLGRPLCGLSNLGDLKPRQQTLVSLLGRPSLVENTGRPLSGLHYFLSLDLHTNNKGYVRVVVPVEHAAPSVCRDNPTWMWCVLRGGRTKLF